MGFENNVKLSEGKIYVKNLYNGEWDELAVGEGVVTEVSAFLEAEDGDTPIYIKSVSDESFEFTMEQPLSLKSKIRLFGIWPTVQWGFWNLYWKVRNWFA